jgi:hypothetical protein
MDLPESHFPTWAYAHSDSTQILFHQLQEQISFYHLLLIHHRYHPASAVGHLENGITPEP